MNQVWKKSLLSWLLVALSSVLVAQNMTARDYFLLGTAKYKCHACDKAIEEFTKALELDKNFADAYYGRSLAYTCNREFASAVQDIERAIRLKPDQVLYQEGKARIKLESGKNLEAKANFEVALRMDSLCWQAWYGLAMAERNIDSVENSRKAFEKSIHLNPDFPMSYLGRAEMRIKEGGYEEALDDLQMAGKLAPNYAKVFELRSMAQLKLGNFDAAIADATTATQLDPTNVNAYYYRGEGFFQQQQYQSADQDYAKAISLNKADGRSWYKRALCNDLLGDQITAKKYYGKAIKKNRGLRDAYSNRAAIWEKFEKPKKALLDLNNAVALDPESLDLRLRRGFVHLALDHVQLASDDFVQATRNHPTSGLAFYGLGMARYQNGNVSGACESWKQSAALKEQKASEQLSKYCND
jgi:tetratricopeptide (TPR) repeat protein